MSLTDHHTNFPVQIGGPHTFVTSSPTNFRTQITTIQHVLPQNENSSYSHHVITQLL